MTKTKLAVLFPGVGYHIDKPLMYHSKNLAMQAGYDTIAIEYSDLPTGIKGNAEKMKEAFLIACGQAKEQLSDIDFASYEKVVFISKSIGTAIGAYIDDECGIGATHIYMTPVPQTFDMVREESGIVFHGLADSWCDSDIARARCEEKKLPLYTFENANHSIETGDAMHDLNSLVFIMEKIKEVLGDL